MKVEIKIIPNLDETVIKIETSEITEEIQVLLDKLNQSSRNLITGIQKHKFFVLNTDEINFFFCENQKVYANSDSGIYEVRYKLYEIENQFKNTSFIRLSKSVIANVNKINNLEMSFNGSMCVNFKNGSEEFISRRYVGNIKNYLNIGGK